MAHFFVGIAHSDLKRFLEENIPKKKKKSFVTLGVHDQKLAGSLATEVDVKLTFGNHVQVFKRF